MSEKNDKWVEIQFLSSRINEMRDDVELFNHRIKSYNQGKKRLTYEPYDKYNFTEGLSDTLIEMIEEELKTFMPLVFQNIHDRLNKEIKNKKEEIKKLVEVGSE